MRWMSVAECEPQLLHILRRQHGANIEIAGDQRRPVQHGGEAAHDHKLDVSVAEPLNELIQIVHAAPVRPARAPGPDSTPADAGWHAGRKKG